MRQRREPWRQRRATSAGFDGRGDLLTTRRAGYPECLLSDRRGGRVSDAPPPLWSWLVHTSGGLRPPRQEDEAGVVVEYAGLEVAEVLRDDPQRLCSRVPRRQRGLDG